MPRRNEEVGIAQPGRLLIPMAVVRSLDGGASIGRITAPIGSPALEVVDSESAFSMATVEQEAVVGGFISSVRLWDDDAGVWVAKGISVPAVDTSQQIGLKVQYNGWYWNQNMQLDGVIIDPNGGQMPIWHVLEFVPAATTKTHQWLSTGTLIEGIYQASLQLWAELV